MKMKREICFLFCLVIALVSFAQGSKNYTGHVTDANGKPLAKVSVLLLNAKGNAVTFVKTDAQGKFSIASPEGKEVSKIAFVNLGYARQNIDIGKFTKGDKTIKMEEKVQEIREVEVKPEVFKIKGDTIAYSVLGLREKQDRTIEDVIARIPGIRVDVSGQISYNGKSINKFYVDGKDMAGDSYVMVSKNLSADKVDSVEVLQNHQPIQSLQGKQFCEAAALNLVLKDGVKLHWTGTAELGSGMFLQSPWHWTRKARLVEMYFGNKMSAVSMYKHNNIAEDMEREVMGFGMDYSEQGQLSNIGGIGRGRYGFNNSHLVATNWYFKTGENSSTRLQLTGLWDKSTTHGYSERTYLDVDDGAIIKEERNASSYTSHWKGIWNYSLNAAKMYFRNELVGNLEFDHSHSLTMLNDKATYERVLPRKRSVSDALDINLPSKKGFNFIRSVFSYSYLPGNLLLYNGTGEQLNLKSMTWSTKYSRSFSFAKRYYAFFDAGYDMARKNEFVSYNDTTSTVFYHEDKVCLNPGLQYNDQNFRASLNCNMTWLSRRFDTDKDSRWVLEPNVSLTWKFIPFWEWQSDYSHTFSPSGFFEVNPLRVYTSYNMASSGTGANNHSSGDKVSSFLRYQTPGYGWSVNVIYSYGTDYYNELYESKLVDGIYTRNSVDESSRSISQSVGGSVGRSFRKLRTRLNLGCNYSWSNYDIMYQGVKAKSDMKSFSSSFCWSMRPWKIFNFEENSSFNISWQESAGRSTVFRNFFHRLNLYLQPDNWQLKVTNECRHSPDGSEKLNIYSDAALSYKTQKYELSLTCKNLLGENKREYRSISVTGSSYSITELRPREILASITFNI